MSEVNWPTQDNDTSFPQKADMLKNGKIQSIKEEILSLKWFFYLNSLVIALN